MEITILLNTQGDGFKITYLYQKLTIEKACEVHPLIGQMAKANTRELVANALRAFQKETKIRGKYNNYWQSPKYVIQSDNKEEIEIILYHQNTSYWGHTSNPGSLHSESLEKMIAFVEDVDKITIKSCNIL